MKKGDPDRGLFLRGRRWYLRAYVPGQGRKIFAMIPNGHSRATTHKPTARLLARDKRRDLKAGQETEPMSLEAMLTAFGKTAMLAGKPRHADQSVAMVRKFLEHQQIGSAAEITTGHVEAYLAHLQSLGRSLSTIWNHRAAISVFCEPLRKDGVLEVNPANAVKIASIQKSLPIFLTPDEADEALEVAKAHGIYAEVATAIFVGLRREELRRLEWSHIDWTRKTLMVPARKSKRTRTVPLSEKIIAILKEHRQAAAEARYVFGADDGDLRSLDWWGNAIKPLQKAIGAFRRREPGSVGRGWHVLRHTFASWLAQDGVSLYKIAEWLGHTDVRTTSMYAHLAPKYDPDIERLHRHR